MSTIGKCHDTGHRKKPISPILGKQVEGVRVAQDMSGSWSMEAYRAKKTECLNNWNVGCADVR